MLTICAAFTAQNGTPCSRPSRVSSRTCQGRTGPAFPLLVDLAGLPQRFAVAVDGEMHRGERRFRRPVVNRDVGLEEVEFFAEIVTDPGSAAIGLKWRMHEDAMHRDFAPHLDS